jgi:hypothetical protein
VDSSLNRTTLTIYATIVRSCSLSATIVDSLLNRTIPTIYATIVRLLLITTVDLLLDRTAPTVYERFVHAQGFMLSYKIRQKITYDRRIKAVKLVLN